MALNGQTREETDKYLAENFDLADRAGAARRGLRDRRGVSRFPQGAGFDPGRTSVRPSTMIAVAKHDRLVVSGAREHNLKDVTVSLPRDALTVITGLSGSGKSSLAFDTIYAEGQRRYVESLSAYARQFLGQMDKPDVDSIEGLSPAISIDQKTTSRNPRSTVGTVTEIYDYLRLLWARVGQPHCHVCGAPIAGQSVEQIVDQVMELDEGTRFMVMAPIVRGRKGEYGKVFEELRTDGYARVKVDGELRLLEDPIDLDKKFKHDISVVVDRLVLRHDVRKRLVDSVETAVALADGIIEIELLPRDGAPGETLQFSERFACLKCGTSMPELEPRIFSFNSPHGACERCTGLGSQREIDPELIVPDPALSIAEGALAPWANSSSSYYEQIMEAIAERYGADLETPWDELSEEHQDLFLYGTNGEPVNVTYRNRYGRQRSYQTRFEGIIPNLERRYKRDRLGVLAREDRGVHERAAVPGVQGLAAAARVARGARRRARDPRVRAAVGRRGAALARRGGAHRDRAPHRAADPARDRGAAALPRERRHRLPVDGPRGGDAVAAARRSGSGWRRRSGRRWWACCTSSTSRRSACTSATTRSSSGRWSGCATSATR